MGIVFCLDLIVFPARLHAAQQRHDFGVQPLRVLIRGGKCLGQAHNFGLGCSHGVFFAHAYVLSNAICVANLKSLSAE